MHSRDLQSKIVWISYDQREVGSQMVWIANGIWNPGAQLFENLDKWVPFCQKPLEKWTKNSGFQMAGVGYIQVIIRPVKPPFKQSYAYNMYKTYPLPCT